MKLLIALTPLVLCSCVSLEDARRSAASKSSYALCYNLATAVLAQNSLRTAWADELSGRGENCSQYMGMISAEQASNAQAMQLATQLTQPRPAPTPSPLPANFGQPTAVLKYSYPSGANRVCVYNRAGSDYVVTQTVTLPCPPTQ